MVTKFKSWLMAQTRIVRYFVVALLFHLGLALLLGSITIVSVLPGKFAAAFESVPVRQAVTEPDPYAAYRDFEYQGDKLTSEKPAGPSVPQSYLAKIEAPPNQAGIAEVIGVASVEATAMARPVGTSGPIGPSFSAGDLKVGFSDIKGPGGALVGSRTGQGRAIAMNQFGGSVAVEKAVLAGLRWLKDNQEPDGSWKKQGAPPVAGTALAVLCFLGHGETTDSKEFGPTVAKGLQFLVGSVGPEGTVAGGAMYIHALAILALAEGLTMTGSPALRAPLEQMVKATIAAQNVPKQNPLHNGGWRYGLNSNDSDTSVTGWVIMGLKSARNAGVEVPDEVFDKAAKYLWNMYDKDDKFGYSSPVIGPNDSKAMSAVGVLCMQFMGHGNDRRLRPVLMSLEKDPVDWEKGKGSFLLYQWYYTTQAMFQAGDPFWPSWNRVFRDEFVKNQEKDGHWDNPPGGTEKVLGPVYNTTLSILSLEVYYRYLPMYKILEQQKNVPVAPAPAAGATP